MQFTVLTKIATGLLFVGVLLSSCSSGPTLDCDNMESFESSINAMKADMTAEQQSELDAHLMVATMAGIAKMSNEGPPPEGDPEEAAMMMLKEYCGLTAEQIGKKVESIDLE